MSKALKVVWMTIVAAVMTTSLAFAQAAPSPAPDGGARTPATAQTTPKKHKGKKSGKKKHGKKGKKKTGTAPQ